MEYIVFSFWFTVIHTASYTIAGVLGLRIGKELYEQKNRLLDFLRNMSDENENKYVSKWFIPVQLLRGLLMSIVLYPILGALGELSFGLRFAFLSGLMFIYTDLASTVPFPHNLEGFIYMKDRYLKRELFGKLYFEVLIYSLLFGFLASWLLF